MNENELILRAQNNDIEALEELIKKYQSRIFNLVVYRIKDRMLAEDITQEIFIRLFKNINKFSFKSKFCTWLYTLANNVIKDSCKKYSTITKRSVPFEMLEQKFIVNEKEIKKEEIERIVQEAIFTLPDEFRTVLILIDMQGFDYKEVSQIIKIPIGTVKSRLYRARQFIKDYILRKYGNILATWTV